MKRSSGIKKTNENDKMNGERKSYRMKGGSQGTKRKEEIGLEE
jgi:hypothetical protein